MLRHDAPAAPVATGARLRLGSPFRWLAAAVVILAGIVLGLAAVLVSPAVTTTPGEALADSLITAWNDHDLDATRGLYTDDAVLMTSNRGEQSSGIDEILEQVRYGGLTIERIGPVTEQGNLAFWPIHVANGYDVSGSDAVAVMYLREGRIAQHWVIWSE